MPGGGNIIIMGGIGPIGGIIPGIGGTPLGGGAYLDSAPFPSIPSPFAGRASGSC